LSLSIRGFEDLLQSRFVELRRLLDCGVAAVLVLAAVRAARTAHKGQAGDERDGWECAFHDGPLESAFSGAISGRRAATAINISPTRRLRAPGRVPDPTHRRVAVALSRPSPPAPRRCPPAPRRC